MPGFREVNPRQSFPELEERILERWREGDVFARQVAQREGSPLWSFYEGPPTANGKPAPTTCSRGSTRTSIRATTR
jgi:isoleucyl-tRNA synthetase